MTAFAVHHAALDGRGVTMGYVREGAGGFPLVLVHGWPETMRVWWRNIEPLAAAGFEVIVPDLRGFGTTGPARDEFYDPASMAADVYTLVHDVLGHAQCTTSGGDLGGVVLQDLALRYPGFVVRQCLFNTVLPDLPDEYAAAGVPPDPPRTHRPTADYFIRQGFDADGLAAELSTPERRRAYIAEFYGHRLWASPGTFTPDDVAFMTEPFGNADVLRTSFGCYETACRTRPAWVPARLREPNPVPTLVLWGPDDHVIPPNFMEKAAVAFTECIGPFAVPGAGHFLQWEAAGVLNRALAYFLRDLTTR